MRDDDAGAGHRRDVDRIVADAVARDDPQTAIAARYGGVADPREVDVERVVTRRMVGGDFRNDFGQVIPFESGRAIEDLQRRLAERRFAARIEDVTSETDAEFPGHGRSLRVLVALRMIPRPFVNARCSIIWSRP